MLETLLMLFWSLSVRSPKAMPANVPTVLDYEVKVGYNIGDTIKTEVYWERQNGTKYKGYYSYWADYFFQDQILTALRLEREEAYSINSQSLAFTWPEARGLKIGLACNAQAYRHPRALGVINYKTGWLEANIESDYLNRTLLDLSLRKEFAATKNSYFIPLAKWRYQDIDGSIKKIFQMKIEYQWRYRI